MRSIQQRKVIPRRKIILGVDPGTIITGYGVIEASNSELKLKTYNVIQSTSAEPLSLRLKKIFDVLTGIFSKYQPDEFAIETTFYGKNVQSALKIGQARGVALLVAANFGISTEEYSPREIKKSVTGNGGASKRQVQYMVQSQLHLKTAPKYFDATDALAVALCHFYRSGSLQHNEKHSSKSWEQFIHHHPEKVVNVR